MATTRTSAAAQGSLRLRGGDSWQLRVYTGTDPATARQHYTTRTVHGTRRTATRALAALVAEVDGAALHAGSTGDLLQHWWTAASPGWAATTAAHTRSIIRCHLTPELGQVRVAALTTLDIDRMYGRLLTTGGDGGGGLAASTVGRIHGVLHRALAQALRWEWIWTNPAAMASRHGSDGPRSTRPPRTRSPGCSKGYGSMGSLTSIAES